ncbi:restriction endonuclease subunit S [Acinetobacter ursingii]|nr:restriction endonuclease subunit S [Acinetobacter ursingii]
MSFETIKDIVDFNPSRPLSKGKEFPFIDMASLPVNGRDINEVSNKVFNGGGAKFKNGDTLFARITPCLENGKTAKVENLPVGCIAHGSTEFIVLSAKSKDDEDFVYYLARLPDFRSYAISRMEGTSGRQRVSWQALAEFNLRLPEKGKRKKIGKILKSLDDKIHLNNQINQTLESIAQTIFKSWFIDFDPVRAKIAAKQEGKDAELAAMCAISGKSEAEVEQMAKEDFAELQATATLFPDELVESELGEVPKGWDKYSLSKMITLIGGGTPKRSEPNYWNGDIFWFSVKDVPNEGEVFVITTQEKISELGLNKSSTKLLPVGTTIITARGTVGKIALVGYEMAMNQSCYGVQGINGVRQFMTYYLIKNAVEVLKKNTHGAVFDTITQSTFDTVTSIKPSIEMMDLFESKVEKIMGHIKNNLYENNSLIA